MKVKSGDLVEVTWEHGGTSQHRVQEVANPKGVLFEVNGLKMGALWEHVKLVAANVDLTPVEAHAVYSMIVEHLPDNFTTDQKAALTSVLNKIQRVARSAEEQS